MSTSPNREAAVRLAEMGFRVFPCTNDPGSEWHKKPLVKGWPDTPIRPAWQVGAIWTAHLDALPAIVTDGIVVIDCDRKHGIDGVANFTTLCGEWGIDLSTNTLTVETPSGGLHFFFKSDMPFVGEVGKVVSGVDIRSHGNYVIAPGSVIADGRAYRIAAGSLNAIPALPIALAALLRPKADSSLPLPAPAPQNVTERERHYGAEVLERCLEEISALTEGERNNKFNAISYHVFRQCGAGRIEPTHSVYELLRAARSIGLPEREARATIESAMKSGLSNPAEPLDEVPKWIPIMVGNWIEAYKAKLATKQNVSKVELVSFADIEERAIDWMWEGFIPKGKLLLLAGAGGSGKSTITCSFAATITNAGLWPDHSQCGAAANYLIWSSEDDPNDIIKPRLLAANANVHRCRFIQGAKDEEGNTRSFDPANDMEHLSEAVASLGNVSMVVIDPIVQAVQGDMYRPNEVRRSLQPIVDFASRFNCAVVGITHVTKGSRDTESVDRILGSTAFKDFARGALMVGREEGTNNRVMVRAKSNLGQDSGGFLFTIESKELHRNINTSRIVWGNFIDGSARSILAKIEGGTEADGEKMQVAKRFLIEVLSNGPTPAKELINHASEGYGIKEDTLRRAFTALSGMITRSGFGKGSLSMWTLPFADSLR
jgi:energy-coupling factor transporter ATP-binding protein EcfA2